MLLLFYYSKQWPLSLVVHDNHELVRCSSTMPYRVVRIEVQLNSHLLNQCWVQAPFHYFHHQVSLDILHMNQQEFDFLVTAVDNTTTGCI